MLKAVCLGLWGLVLVQSAISGRLDLLLRAVFHPLVWLGGAWLLALAAVQGIGAVRSPAKRERPRWGLLLGCVTAVAVLVVPPTPSFADLAANRDPNLLEEPELTFVVPPGQRTLTEWVRLLRSQPDPRLHEGDPVRISGFVLPMPGEQPQLARLLVRCCLVDAVPVGLPMRWPAGARLRPDQWLAVEGVMGSEPFDGRQRSVVTVQRMRPIPRPRRPLEP